MNYGKILSMLKIVQPLFADPTTDADYEVAIEFEKLIEKVLKGA